MDRIPWYVMIPDIVFADEQIALVPIKFSKEKDRLKAPMSFRDDARIYFRVAIYFKNICFLFCSFTL